MPDDERLPDDVAAPAETPPEAPEPATQAAPPTVDRSAELDEMRGMLRELGSAVNGLRETVAMQAAQRQTAGTAPAPVADVTDAELEQAFAEGRGAQAMQQRIEARLDRFAREHVAPIASAVNDVGIPTMANLSTQVAAMGLKDFGKYKGEIEAALATVPAAARMNPEVVRWAYNAVRGNHLDEIVAAEREATIRQFRENPASLPGSTPGRTQPAESKRPSVRELFGEETEAGVKRFGGEDAVARKMGYKDYDDFLERTDPEKLAALAPEGSA